MTAPAISAPALPDLDVLDERTPILAGKLRRMDPRMLAEIFTPKEDS